MHRQVYKLSLCILNMATKKTKTKRTKKVKGVRAKSKNARVKRTTKTRDKSTVKRYNIHLSDVVALRKELMLAGLFITAAGFLWLMSLSGEIKLDPTALPFLVILIGFFVMMSSVRIENK